MISIIANETAGHGTAAGTLADLKRHLVSKGVTFEVFSTQFSGHATELAAAAAKNGAQYVFALGGDGTIREVSEGLRETDVPMGIIPAGTGNDIIKALNLPRSPLEAFDEAIRRGPRKIDMGSINGISFLNVVGTGFDIETLQWTLKFKKRMKGILPYLLGVICSIATHKDVDVSLTVDGTQKNISALLVSVANGVCFGGGMKVAPDARPDDGLFDLLIINSCPKWKIPFLLPKFLSGRVNGIKYAEASRCRHVVIERAGQIMDIDGELIEMDRAEIQMHENTFWVLA